MASFWSTQKRITISQNGQAIAALDYGGYVITWHYYAQDGGYRRIYAQRFAANGDKVDAEFLVNGSNDFHRFNPEITALNGGGFVVTWHVAGQDGSGLGVYAKQFEGQLFGTASGEKIVDIVGANWLDGQAGNDVLKGRGGNDKIFGGGGKDFLTGGSGSDKFVFQSAADSVSSSQADVIEDFDIGSDLIDLRIVSVGLQFIGFAAFTGLANEIKVGTSAQGNTIFRVDVDGDGVTDMKIVIIGDMALTDTDFLF